MGRVSRYKKVKSIDPFAKNGSWKSDVGDCKTLRRAKRKSKTALKMKEQKMNKFQRRMRGKQEAGARKTGGSNGFGDDDGYDLPPEGEDEFDINDMIKSVKKQKLPKSNPLFDEKNSSTIASVAKKSGGEGEKWTRKVEKVDLRGVSIPSKAAGVNDSAPSSNSNQKKKANSSKARVKYDGTSAITASTPIREIIEACNNPKSQKQTNNDASSTGGMSKKEKRKAFLEKKKLKKSNKRGMSALDDDDDDDYANQQALQSLHSQSHTSQNKAKKHIVKQDNYSDTMVARTAFDDQVERPPTFTSLPRGANKLAKNKKAKYSATNGDGLMEEDESAKAQRIRKEQQVMDAMREKVMKQYAMLRESRRSGHR
ncbi:hypothetical protein ACHAXR_008674 [Thalassiosira sp. AJA248-18]